MTIFLPRVRQVATGLLLMSYFCNGSLLGDTTPDLDTSGVSPAVQAKDPAMGTICEAGESCHSKGQTAAPVLLQKGVKSSKMIKREVVEADEEDHVEATKEAEEVKKHDKEYNNKHKKQHMQEHHEREHARKHSFASQPAGPPKPTSKNEEDKAIAESDEPDTAPSWSQCLLIFFAFATVIFFVLVIVLGILQAVFNWVEHVTDVRLAQLDAQRASASSKAKLQTEPAAKPNKTMEQVAHGITADELAAFMNGDHKRLETLLRIADSASPEARVQSLVQHASESYKLKLSPTALNSACTGLQALMVAVREKQKKRVGSFNARLKFQGAVREVLFAIKLRRMLKSPVHENAEERAMTSTHGHSDQTKDKYDDGHKDSIHGKFQDTRLKKISKSGWSAYFTSEKFLDHTAIAFVFFYSQVCAFVYAMYLMLRFPNMYAFMGPWLLVSRGEAMAVIVLTVLMIMLLTRGLLTSLRPYCFGTVLQSIADKSVMIHKYIGMMLVFCAVLHVIGHFRGSIPAIVGETDSSKINAAFTYGTKIKFNFNTWEEALRCWPAVTGYMLLLILIAFWALSNEKVRRWSFELFHYPHLFLMTAWCGVLIAHGWKQWLGLGVPLASVSVLPVLLFYAFERLIAINRGSNPDIKISNAIIKKRTVMMEIDTGSTGYSYETGMYCMLKAPEISNTQWHPFTIASGGGHRKFQVLFAVVGDWTTQLKNSIKAAQDAKSPYPRICARGGYGAPAEGMKDKEHILMVGGGVGATPFLSFLSNISHSASTHGEQDHFPNLKSAAFFWVSREPDDFQWVNQYAQIIRVTPGLKDKVSVHLCLTKNLDAVATEDCGSSEVALFWVGVDLALNEFPSEELKHELGVPTQFGRPNWQKEFTKHLEGLKKKHKDVSEVSVYACGNMMLVNSLEEAASVVSDASTQFRLFAEEF